MICDNDVFVPLSLYLLSPSGKVALRESTAAMQTDGLKEALRQPGESFGIVVFRKATNS